MDTWVRSLRQEQIDGLAQDCSNSIANTLDSLESYTKPSICIYALSDRLTELRRHDAAISSTRLDICSGIRTNNVCVWLVPMANVSKWNLC